MTQNIVIVNVAITKAPAPSTLQQTGAILSQGVTSLASGTYGLLTQASDLTPLLKAPLALSALAWASGVATATTAAPLPAHLPVGATFPTTIAGATPAGYNGQVLATVTGASAFTFPLAANPGSETVPGTYTVTDELVSQVATFFAQGAATSVYVLELGEGTYAAGVTALGAFITANPPTFYAYLVPRNWDTEATFRTFMAGFESNTSKTYFFITSTTGNYGNYTAQMKCAFVLIEAPTRPLTEFSVAFPFWKLLNYNPSSTNKVTPFAFTEGFGVTPYPVMGNAALFSTLKTAGVNIIGTGAEGGITTAILFWGTTMDGEDMASWWYSIDWIQINLDLNLANAIINGSNDPINPLYYNQNGINVLQDTAANTVTTAITDGMALGPVAKVGLDANTFTQQLDQGAFEGECVVNAIPFLTYTKANPNDYGIRKYAGLSVVYIPQNGFTLVIVNIDVTNII